MSDCSACSSSASSGAALSQIQFVLLRKGLDAQKLQGDAANQLLQANLRLSKAPDKGQNFDVLA